MNGGHKPSVLDRALRLFAEVRSGEGANVLMLDEPTNDLDVDTLRALEDALDLDPGYQPALDLLQRIDC